MSATDYTPRTARVTRIFREATDAQRAEGRDWYLAANTFALGLSERYGVSHDAAAGVIAATSPLASWAQNCKTAVRVAESGGTLSEGYLYKNLAKANAIWLGADPLSVLSGRKVIAFYEGIRTAGATDVVTIDRHAFSLAVGDRSISNNMPKLSNKLYDATVEVYRRAADIVSRETGESWHAAQVQAATWVAWRRLRWSEGAFDPR